MRCRVNTVSRTLLALSLISGTMVAQTRKAKPNTTPAAATARQEARFQAMLRKLGL